ncbi:hypothetical protein B0H66DRAFT_343399 [Apodospora peruviana]|uniref:Uncharacterized protein n=1 Tax=Apodospora peruviana TaxID=516989 RepID=A0AAE0HYS4_9PEZI|nr:hypothetical protein B0H66DRAFT_343399 [Apodospora peruviana]
MNIHGTGSPDSQANNTTNPLPSQLGPFVFAPISDGSQSIANHCQSHRPAAKGKTDNRALFQAQNWRSEIVNNHKPEGMSMQDRENRKNRTETWLSGLRPELFIDPELALPLPSSMTITQHENDVTVRQPKLATASPTLSESPMIRQFQKDLGASYRDGPERIVGAVEETRAIRGNFIPVSKSLKTRTPRSPSPKRVLQLSLTDSQMDRLTSVLSQDGDDEMPLRGGHGEEPMLFHNRHEQEPLPFRGLSEEGAPVRGRQIPQSSSFAKQVNFENQAPNSSPSRPRSPAKNQPAKTPSRARSRSPLKFWSNGKNNDGRRAAHNSDPTSTRSQSPTKESGHRQIASNGTHPMASSRSAARRVQQGHLKQLDTELAQHSAKPTASSQRRRSKGPTVAQRSYEMNRLSADLTKELFVSDVSSSNYSQDPDNTRFTGRISPLRIKKEEVPKHVSILQGYADWMNSPGVPEHESEASRLAHLQKARGSDRAGTNQSTVSAAEPQFSAIAPFAHRESQRAQVTRMASKTLIGHNGWLESTSKPAEAKQSPSRKPNLFDQLVKKAREMVEKGNDNKAQRQSRDSDKSQPGNARSLAISLNPREQSLVYCELEYALTTALNDYITAEFNAGRLEADKLKKISEHWQQRGRPKVVSFRYDLETQLELVKLHVNDFKFYGRTVLPTAIAGVLDMMKVNARALRIRTFCQPDTVIAKQLLDSQNLFNILGCPEQQQIQLAEITTFFKAVLERQRVFAEREERATELRRTKSTSGEKWQQQQREQQQSLPQQNDATTNNQMRRTESHGAMRMDPTDYDYDDGQYRAIL